MAGPENTNQKIEATTKNVDVSQNPDSFAKNRDSLKGGDPVEPEDKAALADIEDQLNPDGGKNERQKEVMNKLKAWREKWKAGDIIPDEVLAEHLNTPRLDKTVELLEKSVKHIRLVLAARDRGREADTQPYVVFDGKKYDTTGLKWDYREKDVVEDRINIVPDDAPDVEFGGSEKKKTPEKFPNQETSFEKTIFTDSGKSEFMKLFDKFGANKEKAYEHNINILKGEIAKYQNGKLSRDDFEKQLKQDNKNLGAEIFDVEAILKLQKPKTISSGKGADQDAW
jgi:hypothetical protein